MLYIVRGLPGAGKSTYAKSLGCLVYEADQYFMKGGKYVWDPRRIKNAHIWCKRNVGQMLSRELDVCVANTFVKTEHIQEYIDLANKFRSEYCVIKIVGDHKNVHNVPDEVVARMKSEWEDWKGERIIDTQQNSQNN